MIHEEFNFACHKTNFYGQLWKPKPPAKAVVLLIHGMGEHSGRYQHVAQVLTDQNFGVIALDHYGHGKTEGKRGHNPGYEKVLDSVAALIEKSLAVFGELPMFLYGHSMGGNVVTNFILRRESKIVGVVATSPFLRLAFQPPAWKLALGKWMQKIAPSVTLGNELDASDVSRDVKEVEMYRNDPLVHDRVSPNFSLAFIDSGAWAIAHANSLQVPMILLHGTGDKIIDHKGTQAFAEQSGLADLKLYEGGFHELHNDICREEVFTDIVEWLEKQLEKK